MIDLPFLDVIKESGEMGLFLVALTESIFFPIPPDFLYIPMILGGHEHPYLLAMLASIASVIGAIIAYGIGFWGGRPLVYKLSNKSIEKYLVQVEDFFAKYGSVSILLAAFTPIPFKVFTLSSGMAKMPFKRFILFSILGRAGRFYLVSFLLVKFGESLMQNFFKFSLLLTIPVIIYIFLKKKNNQL
ncbi:MAG: DedA family protein [Candidatus Caenarcaniphilales bacterium]|nr:DedA family protein [Candidatus Caenarcaniphilales bacterium]